MNYVLEYFDVNERHPATRQVRGLRRDAADVWLVIDGVKHSGQTALVSALPASVQRHCVSHVHSIASLVWARWHGIPVFVSMRAPEENAESCWARGVVPQISDAIDPPISMTTALAAWLVFHIGVLLLNIPVVPVDAHAGTASLGGHGLDWEHSERNAFIGIKPSAPALSRFGRILLSAANSLHAVLSRRQHV